MFLLSVDKECCKNLPFPNNFPTSTFSKQGMCHGAICKPDMDAVHEWVYDKTEGVFLAGEY